jgi:predicted nucleic acid-binding protein
MEKIFFETTIFNYYFDQDRGDLHRSAVAIFEAVGRGVFEGFTSTNVVDELRNAEEPKQTNMLNLINKYNITILTATSEVERLASLYIRAGIIPIKYEYDASHIA